MDFIFSSTYFALKKDDDHQKLADTIDKTLKDMKADGTLKKLSEQFLSKDYTVPCLLYTSIPQVFLFNFVIGNGFLILFHS